MSLIFIGTDGREEKRYNMFNALPTNYGPAYDSCLSGGSQEVIVFDFTLIENG
jgi:hypothetical protein